MTLLHRATRFAALALAVATFGAVSPAKAGEIDRGAVAAIRAVAVASVTPPVTAVAPLPIDEAVTVRSATFDSLAAAVAAQDGTDDADARCLAGAVYFESKGEPLAGQLAVAQVVINRARSGHYPASVCGVVTQRGQFSFVRGGAIPPIDPARAGYRTALAVAKVALRAAWDSPAPNALFFHARRVAASARMVRVAAIGNHIFYR